MMSFVILGLDEKTVHFTHFYVVVGYIDMVSLQRRCTLRWKGLNVFLNHLYVERGSSVVECHSDSYSQSTEPGFESLF